MHAIEILDDDPKTLSWQETEDLTPGPDEVLLKIHAAGVNRADLVQRRGAYPPPPGASHILGLEASGEVTACGENVSETLIGKRFCVLLTGGAYAEYVCCPASMLMPIPDGLSMTQAAALPEVFATAWLNLFMEAALQPGEHALIHAAASGVGTAAIQLCHTFGITSYATASAPKLDFLKELGADVTIDRHTQDFVDVIREHRNKQGVDVILDPVGGAYLEKNINTLSTKGRLVLIGLMGGRSAELPLGRVLVKRLRIIGSVLRSRPLEEKLPLMQQLTEHVWPRIASGEIKPIIHQTFPMEQAHQAHELLASNTTIGKIILVSSQT